MNNNNLEKENSFQPVAKHNLLNVFLFIYLVICLAIFYFDFGSNAASIEFVNWLNTLIPSIKPTAQITPMPNNASLVLACSWSMILVSFGIILKISNWEAIDFHAFYRKIPTWTTYLTFILVPILIAYLRVDVPSTNNNGVNGKLIFKSLKSIPYFIVLYGAVIWAFITAGLFGVTFHLVYFFNKVIRSN